MIYWRIVILCERRKIISENTFNKALSASITTAPGIPLNVSWPRHSQEHKFFEQALVKVTQRTTFHIRKKCMSRNYRIKTPNGIKCSPFPHFRFLKIARAEGIFQNFQVDLKFALHTVQVLRKFYQTFLLRIPIYRYSH